VPLFIREGAGLLIQNTTGITQTKQLKNKFILKAGLAYDEKRSTIDIQIYTAVVSLLSIQDFSD
jgi:hypothetical protein